MNNKVLLVYPGGFNRLFPELPLPLLYLSWALMQKDFSVEILDTPIRQYSDMKNFDYLFVGISTMTGSMIGEGLNVAKHVRRFNKEVPLVWGGIHPTLLPRQTLENEFVDIVVRGEGERTIQDLAFALQNQGSLSEVKGISYKQGARIVSNPDRKYKTISVITRFPFWREKFALKDVGSIIGGSRFNKFPLNIVYWLLTNMAILRWKKKYFKYPIEWILLEKALEKMRGFV